MRELKDEREHQSTHRMHCDETEQQLPPCEVQNNGGHHNHVPEINRLRDEKTAEAAQLLAGGFIIRFVTEFKKLHEVFRRHPEKSLKTIKHAGINNLKA